MAKRWESEKKKPLNLVPKLEEKENQTWLRNDRTEPAREEGGFAPYFFSSVNATMPVWGEKIFLNPQPIYGTTTPTVERHQLL